MTKPKFLKFVRKQILRNIILRYELTRKLYAKFLRYLDAIGRLLTQTKIGARLVCFILPEATPVICEECLSAHGLRIDVQCIGITSALPCPNCGSNNKDTKKLTKYLVRVLADRYFVQGSIYKYEYGAAPLVQYNEVRYPDGSDYEGSQWIQKDILVINEGGKIGLFHYGPRYWMFGHIEPLKALQENQNRGEIVARILAEYPESALTPGQIIYRLRTNPENPNNIQEFDSPPEKHLGGGRLDSANFPLLYCSQNIETCVHECRTTVEDDLYIATLTPARKLRLLDLTASLDEPRVTEFESLSLSVHMLFRAAEHSYDISKSIAIAAKEADFDGILYPSYFNTVQAQWRPYDSPSDTVLGTSIRHFPSAVQSQETDVYSNVAFFGRPIREGAIKVQCIERLVIHKIDYEFGFGPVPEKVPSKHVGNPWEKPD